MKIANHTWVTLVVLSVGLSGCSTVSAKFARFVGIHRTSHQVDVRAASIGLDSRPMPSVTDRLYDSASEAIRARNYGTALDLLQMAKQESPNDVRVLDALGVVYDKVGRFDLSSRYYRLALAANPMSPVVAANMRYSAQLQQESVALAAQSPPTQQSAGTGRAPSATHADSPLIAASAAPELTLAQSAVTPRQLGPIYAGSSLTVVNASGRAAGQEPVRQYLASEGWSVRSKSETRAAQTTSEVRFAGRHRVLAQALARTLPFPVSLRSCGMECSGIELVIGSDATIRNRASKKEGNS